MNTEFEHPYWDLYLELLSLKHSFHSPSGRRALMQLAKRVSFRPLELLQLNVLTACPGCKFCCVEELFFCVLRERFAYSVLSPEALELVAASSPFVELGAGNGYVAWTLRQIGVDIVALEAYPVEEGRNWFFNTKFGLPTRGGRSWTEVEKGTAKDLSKHSDRTLLLCWPPRNRMASTALRFFSGNKLALVIEKSCCANTSFFKELEKNWTIQYSYPTGSWSSCHAETFEVYSRNQTAESSQSTKCNITTSK